MAEKYRDGFRRGTGIAINPLKIVWFILMFVIGFCIIAIVAIFLISVIVASSQSGTAEYLEKNFLIRVQNYDIGRSLVSWGESLVSLTSPEGQAEILTESYGWKASVDSNSINKNLGLKFESFSPAKDVYIVDRFDKVVAYGRGKIETVEQDMSVFFECFTEDDKKGEVTNLEGPLRVTEDRLQLFNIRCDYDKELFDIDTSKILDTQNLMLKATYDFVTTGYVYVYLLNKDIMRQRLEKHKEIMYDFPNPKIKSNGESEFVATEGPIQLKLRIINSIQPLSEAGPNGPYTEGGSYDLAVRIDDNLYWKGRLKEIKEFYIYITNELELLDEDNYFDSVGEEDGFIKYEANNMFIDELNSICDEGEDLLEINENCWRRGDIETIVNFVVHPIDKEYTEETYIRAKLVVRYQDQIKSIVTFKNENE